MSRAGQGPILETMTWLGALCSSVTHVWTLMLHSAFNGPASDFDVLRTASLLLGEHGEDAFAEAARMTAHFAQTGDVKKSQYWRRVMKSLADFRRAEHHPH